MGKCLKMDQSLKTLADISKLCDLNAATDLVLIPNKRLASAVRESWSIEKSKTCKTWCSKVKTSSESSNVGLTVVGFPSFASGLPFLPVGDIGNVCGGQWECVCTYVRMYV